jgi:hypothetical protein
MGSQMHVCCRKMAACGTYLWGGLVRIDVLDAPISTTLAFYGPRCLRVVASALMDSDCAGADADAHDVSVASASSPSQRRGSHDGAAVRAGDGADISGSEMGTDGVASSSSNEGSGQGGPSTGRDVDVSGDKASTPAPQELLFGAEEVRERGGLRVVKQVQSLLHMASASCRQTSGALPDYWPLMHYLCDFAAADCQCAMLLPGSNTY